MSENVVILRGLDSSVCGTSEEAKFSLCYILVCAGKNKENALISWYFM